MNKGFVLIYNLQLYLISIDKHQSKMENSYGQGSKSSIYLRKSTPHKKQKNPAKMLASYFAMSSVYVLEALM